MASLTKLNIKIGLTLDLDFCLRIGILRRLNLKETSAIQAVKWCRCGDAQMLKGTNPQMHNYSVDRTGYAPSLHIQNRAIAHGDGCPTLGTIDHYTRLAIMDSFRYKHTPVEHWRRQRGCGANGRRVDKHIPPHISTMLAWWQILRHPTPSPGLCLGGLLRR